jgi:transcription termination factor Rho
MALPPKSDEETSSSRSAAKADATKRKRRPASTRSAADILSETMTTRKPRPKKSAAAASTATAPVADATAKSAAPRADAAPARAAEFDFAPEPPRPAPVRADPLPAVPAPVFVPTSGPVFRDPPPPAPEPAAPPPDTGRAEASASNSTASPPPERHSFDPRDESPRDTDQGDRADSPSASGPGKPPAPASSSNAPQQGGRDWQQDRGGGGPGNGGGGGGNDRDFWKHGKRRRGRHGGGGSWQPNGPGGGGSGGGNGGGGGGGPGGGPPRREQHPPQPAPAPAAPVFGDLPHPSRFNDLAALNVFAGDISAGPADPIYLDQLYALTLAELTAFARQAGVTFEGAPTRKQLLAQIFTLAAASRRAIRDRGWIDINAQGAFVVHTHVNYRLYPDDAFLPDTLVRHYGLKRGHHIEVLVQAPQPGERCPSVVRVDTVMGGEPEAIANVTPFEELTPYYPLKRILLENTDVHPKDVSMRAVDILTPIGFGQRGLIVAPPRTGKTVLLQNIANSVSANFPEVKLVLLLIDERPEEVTDFKRHTKGEVVSSTFDETPESHVHCAEMVIEIARRRVEQGEHIVILLDSITRLARAYNALTGNQGKTMSGGLESNALQKPKRFFGSARNIEGGGSLTIIASALIDTGSRMDEIIFEEFKGTGNSELHLDRGLVERRIFPAINIDRSGTRKEELIYHPEELQRIYGLRRAMQGLGPIESMEMLITRLKKTKSNAEFLLSLSRQ